MSQKYFFTKMTLQRYQDVHSSEIFPLLSRQFMSESRYLQPKRPLSNYINFNFILSKNIYQKARDKPCGHLPSSDVYITPCGKKSTFISCTHNFPCHILLRRQNTRNTHIYPRVNKDPGNTRSKISTSTRP